MHTYKKNIFMKRSHDSRRRFRHLRKIMLTLALAFVSGQAFATDSWSNGWISNPTFLPEQGIIKMNARIYQTWGSIGDGHCGFSKGSGWLQISYNVDGVEICKYEYYTNSEGSGVRNDIHLDKKSGANLGAWVENITKSGGDEWEIQSDICIPVRVEDLNKKITIVFNGKWWRRGATADNDVNFSKDVYATVNLGDVEFCMNNGYEFTTSGNIPALRLKAKHTGTPNVRGLNIDFKNSSDNLLGRTTPSLDSVSEILITPTMNNSFFNGSNDNRTYHVNLEKNIIQDKLTYTGNRVTYTFPCYPQVTYFNMAYNSRQNAVLLDWDIPGPATSSAVNGGKFIIRIEHHDTVGNNDRCIKSYTKEINYNSSITDYNSDTILVDQNFKGYVTASVYRSEYKDNPSWIRALKKDDTVFVNSESLRATEISAVFDTTSNLGIVTWKYAGAIWSNGTTATLTRYNTTNGGTITFSLTEAEFKSGEYRDDMLSVCDKYRYKLQVVPGINDTVYSPVWSDTNFFIYSIGEISNPDASKGYHSTRTEISWNARGLFENFGIERREYGNPNSSFQRIAVVTPIGATSTYAYDDVNGNPGTIYQYRIIGYNTCGGAIVTSDTLYTYGFRTSTGDVYGQVTFENSGQAEDGVDVILETTEGQSGQSLAFASGNEGAIVGNNNLLRDSTSAITLQSWVMANNLLTSNQKIISKSGMYELGINNGKFYFKVGYTTVADTTDILSQLVSYDSNLANVYIPSFIQVSATYQNSSNNTSTVSIYVNGKLSISETVNPTVLGNTEPIVFGGENFFGAIDEVRIWGKALTAEEIYSNYNRHIIGNETNLLGYWSFDNAVENEFYDMSCSGTLYNKNHGRLGNGVSLSSHIPTNDQLSYRGTTNSDGAYEVRSVPYWGSGTAYTITPRKGVHKFSPEQSTRLLSSGAQSHTVNFQDKSSFLVSGTVTYAGGNYPVDSVYFTIDGVMAQSGTDVIYSGCCKKDDGNGGYTTPPGYFEISVPVGTHRVVAMKGGHTFAKQGRFTDINGNDINYQDNIINKSITDSTKVTYAGRIAGGTIQQNYPIGHSLSKNNLSDSLSLYIEPLSNGTYEMTLTTHDDTLYHFNPASDTSRSGHYSVSHWNSGTNTGTHNNYIVVKADPITGEFETELFPERYTIRAYAHGHGNIETYNADLRGAVSLANSNVLNNSIYSYNDTIVRIERRFSYDTIYDTLSNGTLSIRNIVSTYHIDTITEIATHNDTLNFNKTKLFIMRNEPELSISQLQMQGSDTEVPYFGSDKYVVTTVLSTDTVPLYNSTTQTYSFGKPVFAQNKIYSYKISMYEPYNHYDIDGHTIISVDKVPTQDGTVSVINSLATEATSTIALDTITGSAEYSFQAAEPVSLTSPTGNFTATATYGEEGTPSISWQQPFADGLAWIVGAKQTGTNFITQGPDKVLAILRDPPGSNSYSYLESGVSWTENSTYTGSLSHEGKEIVETKVGVEIITVTGSPVVGTIQHTETQSGLTVGVEQSAKYTGEDSKETNTTLTTSFQTSDDPQFVGADGDVYIGYSTNLTFGYTDNVTFVKRSKYLGSASYAHVYDETSSSDWVMLQSKGNSVTQSFSTMFFYPQIYIEQSLLPNIESCRNSLLMDSTYIQDTAMLQHLADSLDTVFYVSYFSADNPNYGKSNTDITIANIHNGDSTSDFDGPSYICIYKRNAIDTLENGKTRLRVQVDTINGFNQSIANWIKQLAINEEQKLKSTVKQNYSFHAGSSMEYNESYTGTISHTSSFEISVGGVISNDHDFGASAGASTHSKFSFEEHVSTTQGGTFSSNVERSHAKGFVLAEDGGDNISVDICYETGSSDSYDIDLPSRMVDTNDLKALDYYPTFIFKTRAGATSCPYEGERVTQYYNSSEYPLGTVLDAATMKIEVPSLAVQNNYINNIPSGEAANFTLYLRNDSETGDDANFDLFLVDASNPNGATLSIDGTSISGRHLTYLVPAGSTLTKTLSVRKGTSLTYDSLQIVLASQCQCDPTSYTPVLADTVTLMAHFIPSCTDIDIVSPTNNWVFNSSMSTLPVKMANFDVNYSDFDHIELQYKLSSQSDDYWVPLKYYYNDSALLFAATDPLQGGLSPDDVSMITMINGYLQCDWDMTSLPDQYYDLRAVSYCKIGNTMYTNESEVMSGLKDTYNPRLFGNTQPSNGILTVNDDIKVTFNENIAGGYLVGTDTYFSVSGIRNGAINSHTTNVTFDGMENYMATEASRNLTEKSLNFETWIYTNNINQNATIFSHGDPTNSFELSIDNNRYLTVTIGTNNFTSPDPVDLRTGEWAHVAVNYDASDPDRHMVTVYFNYNSVFTRPVATHYSGNGIFELGRSLKTQNNYFEGKMHNFRVWDKTRTSSTIQTNSLAQMSGNEVGLIACYPMNEGKGTVVNDKARGANMVMHGCNWSYPDGYVLTFAGDSSYAALSSASTIITPDMDGTLEFWFKAETGQRNATILCNGESGGNEANGSKNKFSVSIDAVGNIVFANNGYKVSADGNFVDNCWHQFTYTVNRNTNVARIYMDGLLNKSFAADSIGGMAAENLYIGAKVYNLDGYASIYDVSQPFKGSFDELRIWNLYRTQSLVENYNNQKLNGDETGLLAYYPFETYQEYEGSMYLLSSLKNGCRNSADTTFSTVGDVHYTQDIPPVNDRGPVSDLNYNFVPSSDAIIINLTENPYRVEKTLVTITVSNVEDVNGNVLQSPITWTAYIDRNLLKWSQDEISVSKQENEPLQFNVDILNNGGYIENYTISNMPSWLQVSPTSGTITPTAHTSINFAVDEKLNIGTYNEIIYMTNTDGVSEPLNITVRVLGEEPDWSVDPNQYEYSMSIYGKARINTIFSTDPEDKIAAFRNGTCVGVANVSYNAPMDMWYTLLTCYSNSLTDNNLTFRIWDASTGITYQATPETDIAFVNDSIYGTPQKPVIFNTDSTVFRKYKLNEGWNWVSLNITNSNMSDINSILRDGSWTSSDIVKTMDHTTGSSLTSYSDNFSTNSGRWDGTLTRNYHGFNNTSMFMVKSATSQTLEIEGTIVRPESVTLDILPNWNYISYLPSKNLPLKIALADYEATNGDIIKSKDAFAMYYNNEWVGSLTYMEPNKGYMLRNTSNNAKTFNYPSNAVTSLLKSMDVRPSDSRFDNTMNVIAIVEGFQQGDAVSATVNGEVRGVDAIVPVNENQSLLYISIDGNNDMAEDVHFIWEREGNTTKISSTKLKYRNNSIYGTVEEPLVLKFDEVNPLDEPVSVYPTLFSNDITVSFFTRETTTVNVEIYDMLGRKVYASGSDNYDAGMQYSNVINTTDLVPGNYVIHVIRNNETKVQKIVKH